MRREKNKNAPFSHRLCIGSKIAWIQNFWRCPRHNCTCAAFENDHVTESRRAHRTYSHRDPTESVPPGVMHDYLEDVLRAVEIVMAELISEAVVDLDDFNKAVTGFPYASVDTKKPEPLRREGSRVRIKETASEMRCLLRLLPFSSRKSGI